MDVFQVLSVGNLNPPDVVYQYTVQNSSLAQYVWELSTEWSNCDKICRGKFINEIIFFYLLRFVKIYLMKNIIL